MFSISLLCIASLAAQAGGETTVLDRFDSPQVWSDLGYAVAAAGDVDGDGAADYLLGLPGPFDGGAGASGRAAMISGATGNVLYDIQGGFHWDRFGASVSAGFDADGDGIPDFLIGAPAPTQIGSLTGMAYLYSGATGNLIHTFQAAQADTQFGEAVTLIDDVDGDGMADVVVGEPDSSPNGVSLAGEVHVYSGQNGNPLYSLSGTASIGGFGSILEPIGDVDADGTPDLFIGSINVFGVSPAVYIHAGDSGARIWQLPGGTSAAGLGDLDEDGFDDFLIGEADGGIHRVRVYSGQFANQLYFLVGTSPNDSFGRTVASAGDIDGDGKDDFLVGAPAATVGGPSQTGYVAAYSGITGTHLWTRKEPGLPLNGSLGRSLAGLGDVDGDGYGEFLVGALDRAYVYSFRPFLQTDGQSLSAAAGGTITLDLDFPVLAAGLDYKVLLSEAGVGPTTYGVAIPLTADSLTLRSDQGYYPMPGAFAMHGQLDALGDASAGFTIGPGSASHYIGRTLWIAAVAMPSGSLPVYSSIPVSVTLEP